MAKRLLTVNDLLVRDDIKGMIAELDKRKANIKDLIILYVDRDGEQNGWSITEGTKLETAIYLLEMMKMDLYNDNRQIEEDD